MTSSLEEPDDSTEISPGPQIFVMPAEVRDTEFFDIYLKFIAITGASPWTKRLSRLTQTNRTPLEQGFRRDESPLEVAMDSIFRHLTKFGKLPPADKHSIYQLYAFIFNTVQVYDRLSTKAKNILRGRMLDGLKSDVGLSPLSFEMEIVGGLARRGCSVGFSDLETGGGFDFLAENGGLQVEVECKTLREDIGRKVKRKAALAFYKLIASEAQAALKRLRRGLVLTVVVSDTLELDSASQAKLAKACITTLVTGVSQKSPEGRYEINLVDFDIANTPFHSAAHMGVDQDALDDFVERMTGRRNREAAVFFRPGQAAIVVVLDSAKRDRDVQRWFKEPREAAEVQFTRRRPAILCIRLDGLTEDQLIDLAKSAGSRPNDGLQAVATRMLESPKRTHLASVVFFGRFTGSSWVNSSQEVSSSGSTYVFHNANHPSRHDDRCNVFGPRS